MLQFFPCSVLNISSDDEIEATISSVLGSVESERIRSYLKYLTAEPHIAAGPRDLELTDWIREGFIIFPSTSEELFFCPFYGLISGIKKSFWF